MILRDYQNEAVKRCLNQTLNTLIACPTGSGKTAILGGICSAVIAKAPATTIAVLSHTKEILEQDFEALLNFVNPDNLGIYSAGVGHKKIEQVTVAGIQSVYKMQVFKDFDYIIVDEAHLIPSSGNGMYMKLLSGFKGKVIGLTATPYRLGKGYIYGDDKVFKTICYDLTKKNRFNKLVDDGWISKIYAYDPASNLDTDDVKTIAGDFSLKDMSNKFNRLAVTEKCLKELIPIKDDYKKILVFCIDIQHACDVADYLNSMGVVTEAVHSKSKDRDDIVSRFRKGDTKAITNVDVLTTGFDDPEIDLIVMLRPTKSPVVHVQTIGRGLRVSPGKDHCLVMDFAGNTKRLGPINDIVPYVAKKGGAGEPITKTCPKCNTIHHPSVRVCNKCGHKFEFKTDLSLGNAGNQIITKGVTRYEVVSVKYSIHAKKGKPKSIKVSYYTKAIGLVFHEWVCVEYKGYAKRIALRWMENRGIKSGVDTVSDFMKVSEDFKKPIAITVRTSGKYPEIILHNFAK